MTTALFYRLLILLGFSGVWLLTASLAHAELPAMPTMPTMPTLSTLPGLTEVAQQVVNPLALRWKAHFAAASQATGVDAELLEAMASVESNFNAQAVSRFGAMGLLQIMPRTAAAVGLRGNRLACGVNC